MGVSGLQLPVTGYDHGRPDSGGPVNHTRTRHAQTGTSTVTAKTQRRQFNALQQLIQDHTQLTGETYADIAARGGLPRQTVSALMQRDDYHGVPQARTLDRLAKGLQVSRQTVRDAAARSITLGNGQTAGTPLATVLADLVAVLPEAQVRVLIASAREMVNVGSNGAPANLRSRNPGVSR